MGLRLYDKAKHALRFWLLHNLPTCKEIAPVISQSLERRLSLRERVLLKLHLWVCLWCVWYLEHLHLIRDTLRARAAQASADQPSISASLSAEARERMKRALKSQE